MLDLLKPNAAGLARFAPLATLAAWYLAVGALLRGVLWYAFGRTAGVAAGAMPQIMLAGLVGDFVQALYLLAPFGLFLALCPDRWYRSRPGQTLILAGSFVWVFVMTFVAITEYFFFEEFDARFNLVSVDYLLYPTEVIGDIRDAYPLKTVLVLVAIAAAIFVYALRARLLAHAAPPVSLRMRSAPAVIFTAGLSTCAAFMQTDTLALSTNRVANELAVNGASSFFRALRTSEIDYHAFYATRDRRQNRELLRTELAGAGGEFASLENGSFARRFAARTEGLGRLNVIVVVSEAFGAEFSRLYGSERDWTPQFDRLAQQSLWFRNMYASGTRTVRGLEAIAASFPPIPTTSILRRPGSEGMATWGSVMAAHGYHTSFLYGGYGYFDNMNHFFSSNGFEVRDRASIPEPHRFENIWGVADEDLFDSALSYYDEIARQRKPFFSMIMTTSNHKPFTFREGVPGVKPQGGGRESGVRYADFAQGYFVREAAKHAWFEDTIFVIVADHGARVYGRQEIPLKTYEIPMLIYSPKHIAPRRVDALTTQIDVAPTVLGLLGFAYQAPFFGRDSLNTTEHDRVAFFSHNHDVALFKNGELAILGLQKGEKSVRYERAGERYVQLPLDRKLVNTAIAYYQTAYELFRERRYQ